MNEFVLPRLLSRLECWYEPGNPFTGIIRNLAKPRYHVNSGLPAETTKSWVAGPYGKGLRCTLNNTSTFSANGTETLITGLAQWSIDVVWSKIVAPASVYQHIFGFRTSDSDGLYISSLNGTSLEARYRVNTALYLNGSGNSFPLGCWNHAAITFDGSKVRLYINGAMTSVATTAAWASTTAKLQILKGQYTANDTCAVKRAALWTRCLSANEIMVLECNKQLAYRDIMQSLISVKSPSATFKAYLNYYRRIRNQQ